MQNLCAAGAMLASPHGHSCAAGAMPVFPYGHCWATGARPTLQRRDSCAVADDAAAACQRPFAPAAPTFLSRAVVSASGAQCSLSRAVASAPGAQHTLSRAAVSASAVPTFLSRAVASAPGAQHFLSCAAVSAPAAQCFLARDLKTRREWYKVWSDLALLLRSPAGALVARAPVAALRLVPWTAKTSPGELRSGKGRDLVSTQ